eukprot:c2780_g1_i2.p1 GENE.c2780_g1_i2~~c2780_g1_i2.p1  ORF type:complete len:339 (-),score=78.46 c2780_g1_i2:102-1118(-)
MGCGQSKPSHIEDLGRDRKRASKIEDVYQVGKLLGKGGFAQVRLGVNPHTKAEVALKMIKTEVFKKHEAQTLAEVEVLQQMDHESIVKVFEVVYTPKHFVIVMELLRGGELFDRIVAREYYSEQDARVFCRQLLDAIAYMHDRNVVHRDLKPENIIYATEDANSPFKITDFGFAEVMKDKKLTASCGTPEYVAPEILLGKPYTQTVDLWSFGVIVYILLSGYPPFFSEDGGDEALFKKIESCDWDDKFTDSAWTGVSATAKDFIRRLLVKSTVTRMTAHQALQHPWLDLDTSDTYNGDLTQAKSSLQAYQATRKFRQGILTVIASNRLARLRHLGDPH